LSENLIFPIATLNIPAALLLCAYNHTSLIVICVLIA
jgi:hypothetical protein